MSQENLPKDENSESLENNKEQKSSEEIIENQTEKTKESKPIKEENIFLFIMVFTIILLFLMFFMVIFVVSRTSSSNSEERVKSSSSSSYSSSKSSSSSRFSSSRSSSNSNGYKINNNEIVVPDNTTVTEDLKIEKDTIRIGKKSIIKGNITISNSGNLVVNDEANLEKGANIIGSIKIGNKVTSKGDIFAYQSTIKIGNDNILQDVIINLADKYPNGYLDAGDNNTFGTVDGGGRTDLGKNNIVLGDLKASQNPKTPIDESGRYWQPSVNFESGTVVKGKIIEGTTVKNNSESSSQNSLSSGCIRFNEDIICGNRNSIGTKNTPEGCITVGEDLICGGDGEDVIIN
jgi:hypothetical protein